MKKILYFVYSLCFGIFRLFPVRENRVSLISPHNSNFNDSLKYVRAELEKRGNYEFNCVSSKQLGSFKGIVDFFFGNCLKTATSKYVFLNDNFMPFSRVRFSEKTTVVQLWHGQGAFKKFGLDSNLSESERMLAKKCSEKYDHIVTSSKNVSEIYASAFGVSESRIIPCGVPDSDGLFDENNKGKFRREFSIPEGKKIVLYAPTFREDEDDDGGILENFCVGRFVEELGEKYQLVVRLHPQVHRSGREIEGAIDATDYEDVNSLIIDCDILITDYSSICMEFAFLKKPAVFYAYDLDKYEKSRGFYYDYRSYVPGKVVETMDGVIKAINENDFEEEKIEKFNKMNFDYYDGRSSKRLIDRLQNKL